MDLLHDLGTGSPYSELPFLAPRAMEAIKSLLSRPWWSRVWIVQEVVMGGVGDNIKNILVMCGNKKVGWQEVVITAARLWSAHTQRRQFFPNIQTILDLDRTRHDGKVPLWLASGDAVEGDHKASQWAIGLVSEYRHFEATDARDKVYALSNMFAQFNERNITPDYTRSTSSVYTEFAIWALRNLSSLELLRHCEARAIDVPSSVPDWSVARSCLPLPSKNRSPLRGMPWWSQLVIKKRVDDYAARPEYLEYYCRPEFTAADRKINRRRLKIAAKGYGRIRNLDEIPSSFGHRVYNMVKTMSDSMKEVINADLARGGMLGVVTLPPYEDEGENSLFQHEELGALRTERFLEKSMNYQIAAEVQDIPYQAAGATRPRFHVDDQKLTTEAIVWDEIESAHDGFVCDVDANFEDTTRFMVAIGQCKAMAEDSLCAIRRLPDLEERLKSFWLCILIGRTGTSDLGPSSSADSDTSSTCPDEEIPAEYMHWLPPIPSTWKAGTAPVTATTNGVLELAELFQRFEIAIARTPKIANNTADPISLSAPKFSGLIPKWWSPLEQDMYQRKFRELGLLWSEQRFDLYHMPFTFINVVPDPYWDTRKDHDKLARWKTQELYAEVPKLAVEEINNPRWKNSIVDETHPSSIIFQEEMRRVWKFTTTRIPQGTLRSGFEKYALGRRFFITKKGYFGLASKEAKPGDRIAILSGSDVPFVVRKRAMVEGNRHWQMIGEAYVEGIMNGEVLEQVELGNAQASMICIS